MSVSAYRKRKASREAAVLFLRVMTFFTIGVVPAIRVKVCVSVQIPSLVLRVILTDFAECDTTLTGPQFELAPKAP